MPGPFQILFTDLDGTLLDESDYGYEAALPALGALKARGIPIVFCTSKTFAETRFLQETLGVEAPLIVENGGAIYYRPGDRTSSPAEKWGEWNRHSLGLPYALLTQELHAIREETGIGIRGFADMSVGEISEACGLPLEAAGRAKDRQYDEPFFLEGMSNELPESLALAIAQRGLNVTRGGRFHHLTGFNDKGRATRLLLAAFGVVRSVGIGDSPNDLPMLQAVDQPVIVQRPGAHYDARLLEGLPGALRAGGIGPMGWNRAVLTLLAEEAIHAG